MSTKLPEKYYANRGVERNKKPLQNIIYKIEISTSDSISDKEGYNKYKFKELGYLHLSWQYEKTYNRDKYMNWHGFITPEDLKEKLGNTQWSKFCQGKRIFIIQRRVDGNNIKNVKAS